MSSPSPSLYGSRSSASDGEALSVLLVEDHFEDARQFEENLAEGPAEVALRREESLQAGLDAFGEEQPDVLVVDLGLSNSEGTEIVKAVTGTAPEVPVVALTGPEDFKTALQAQEAGAVEYLRKKELTPPLVARTLRWAVQQSRMQRKLRQRDAWIRSITENVSGGIFRVGPTGGIDYANGALAEMLGFERGADLLGRDLTTFYADPVQQGRMLAEEGVDGLEVELQRRHGSSFFCLLSAEATRDEEGVVLHYDGFLTDITEQKERERRLDAVFNQTYQFTGLMTPDGTMIEANETALQFGGMEREDVIGKPLWEVAWTEADETSVPRLRNAIQRAAEGEFVRYETEMRGEGQDRVVDFSIRPVIDEKGDVELLIPEARDITERKQREEMLQSRRRKVEALYAATSGLLRIERPESIPERILAVLQDVFDFSFGHVDLVDEEAVVPKKTVAKGVSRPPDLKVRSMSEDLMATRALKAGEVVVAEVEALENDFDYGSLSVLAGIPIGERGAVVIGKEDGSVSSFDLRLLEVLSNYAALVWKRREQEELLRSITENISEGIYRSTPDGGIQYANSAFVEMFGYEDLEEVKAIDPTELYARPSERKKLYRLEEEEGGLDGIEVQFRRKDGSTFVGLLSTKNVVDEEGNTSYNDGVIADITDRKEQEHALREAKEEAEEASQLKSAMLANMSHEIRTPLMSMIGSADLLRDEVEGEARELVGHICESGQRLRDTLDSVLQLSRLESGGYDLDREPVPLGVLVREVAQQFHLRAYEKGVDLEVEGPGEAVEARLDETATRRIIANLVENALKFTPQGGDIQVRVRSGEKENVLLEVEDTGIGIAEEAQSKIFEAFEQESEGLDREYEGSGLGLSIVHRLTTHMGGTVDVESEKGDGTRFVLRFPAE